MEEDQLFFNLGSTFIYIKSDLAWKTATIAILKHLSASQRIAFVRGMSLPDYDAKLANPDLIMKNLLILQAQVDLTVIQDVIDSYKLHGASHTSTATKSTMTD